MGLGIPSVIFLLCLISCEGQKDNGDLPDKYKDPARNIFIARPWKVEELIDEVPTADSSDGVNFISNTETVATGDTAILHCSFSGVHRRFKNGLVNWVKEPLGTWEKPTLIARGSQVLSFDDRYKVLTLPHSALSILVIKKATAKDEGKYRCSLNWAAFKHRFIYLNVTTSSLDVYHSALENSVPTGGNVTLTCRVISGYPRPVIYWTGQRQDGKIITFDNGNQEYFGSDLVLTNVQRNDVGTYTCHVDNFVEPKMKRHFKVHVEGTPWYLYAYLQGFNTELFLNQWTPIPGYGETVMLRCETEGMPLPEITWTKNGRPFKANRAQGVSIYSYTPSYRPNYVSSRIRIRDFSAVHEGTYVCSSVNVAGTISRSISLKGQKTTPPPAALPQIPESDRTANNRNRDQAIQKTTASPTRKIRFETPPVRRNPILVTLPNVPQEFKAPPTIFIDFPPNATKTGNTSVETGGRRQQRRKPGRRYRPRNRGSNLRPHWWESATTKSGSKWEGPRWSEYQSSSQRRRTKNVGRPSTGGRWAYSRTLKLLTGRNQISYRDRKKIQQPDTRYT